jgi:hypothetical protein
MRKVKCFLEPLHRSVLPGLVGEPETFLIDSPQFEVLHPLARLACVLFLRSPSDHQKRSHDTRH